MQKKFIALAVAGLVSGAAFAQSNVTIYGVADSTFDIINANNATVGSNNLGSFTRVSTNSSLIGFKGEEALGNGLKAIFQFESSVGFDTGAALNSARDSFVGAAGSFGTVKLGNLTGPTRALGASVDVFAGATGIGANSALLGKAGNLLNGANGVNSDIANAACGRSATCTSLFDSRYKNSIAYVSPSFGGLTVSGLYAANENKGNDLASNLPNTKTYDLGAVYNNGPIMVGLTYNWATTDIAVTDLKVSDLRLAGSYNFGQASVRALYDRTKYDTSTFDQRQTVWGLGGTFNVTSAGKIVGQFYKANDTSGAVNNSETGAQLYALGYEHSLSKRTMVKATYAHLNNKDRASYDFGLNAVGTAAAGATYSGLSVGLRHAF